MTIEEATNDLLSESISNHFQHLAKTQDDIVPCSSRGDTSDSYIRKDTLLGAVGSFRDGAEASLTSVFGMGTGGPSP